MMPMRLEPAAPQSQVKHSTTELLRSLQQITVPSVLHHKIGHLLMIMIGASKLTHNASTKLHLKMSPAANYCITLLTNLSIEANNVDPDQTAPLSSASLIRAVLSGSTLFVKEASATFKEMIKSDDFCCDRRFATR